MILTISDFKDRVRHDIGTLVEKLRTETGRHGSAETQAWRRSLPALSDAFEHKSFDGLHLYFGGRGHLSLEYRLPASFSYADVILLGNHQRRRSAVFIELKDWETRNDRAGCYEGLIERHTGVELHPSEQVKGYADYCRRFHSTVVEHDASVHGCVLFTKDRFTAEYRKSPNDTLTNNFPIFTLDPSDLSVAFPDFFKSRITHPDDEFAEAFERGRYVQRRDFCRQLADQVLQPRASPFVLLDNQRFAFARVLERVENAIFKSDPPRKTVIIIQGPPGCGKSVIAARLWATLVSDQHLPEGNVVITTTSASQSSNWSHVFNLLGDGGKGIIKKANNYFPATTQDVSKLGKKYGDSLGNFARWKENLSLLQNIGWDSRMRDQEMLVSIVDEAHALINPEHSDGRGQHGFHPSLGPQAWHIIRGSVVSIFLLDPEQSFRDRENTAISDIKIWAIGQSAEIPDTIRLDDAQFRCAGSKEYVDWVDALLSSERRSGLKQLAKQWYRSASFEDLDNELLQRNEALETTAVAEEPVPFRLVESRFGFDFRVVDELHTMDRILRQQIAGGATARLAASYARAWKTKGMVFPHSLPSAAMDFCFDADSGGEGVWSRIWNFVPGSGTDYTHFIQAAKGSKISNDPLCEVGCPYAIRGFDFDYIGLLWLSDLVWRGGQWEVNVDLVFETGLARARGRAKKEADPRGKYHRELIAKIAQGYRVLMTRAIKGIYVWFEDEETRSYVSETLS